MQTSRWIGLGVVFAVTAAAAIFQAQASAPASVEVTITIDASKSTGKLRPIWRWDGYDEPNYTYYPNGKNSSASSRATRTPPSAPPTSAPTTS